MITLTTILVWFAYLLGLYFIIFWILVYLEKEDKIKIKKITNWPKVTVAIPAWNEEKTVGGTIQSILDMNYPKDKLEIIVVNDGSKDKTPEIVRKVIQNNLDRNIKLINKKNGGKSSAVNAALRLAKGEYFVCLDADSFAHPDALRKILPHFTDDRIAVVLPLMKVKNPKRLIEKVQWCEYLINFFYKKLMSKLDCVQVAPGPFSVYRKDVLDKLGGFDDKERLTEDLEISLRLQKNHYRLVQLMDAKVYTVAPKTIKALYKQRRRWYRGIILNSVRYRHMAFNKKYGDFGFIQFPRVMLSGILAVFFLFLTLYRFILRPLGRRIYELFHVNFNFLPTMKFYMDNFNLIDLNYTNIFFAIVIFSLSATILIAAYKRTKEPLLKYGPLTVPAYLFLYSFIASLAWAGVVFEILLRKEKKWR